MEQEAMGEVCNIVLNSCLGTLANLLGQELRGSLPSVQIGTGEMLLAPGAGTAPTQLVMLLQIDLAVEAHRIVGHMALMLDMEALAQLQALAQRFLAGEAAP
jgi:chemotaxis protein CheC